MFCDNARIPSGFPGSSYLSQLLRLAVNAPLQSGFLQPDFVPVQEDSSITERFRHEKNIEGLRGL